MYRHISKGSWTFSDQDHGWQVSDCTAEGLKVTYTNFAQMLQVSYSYPYLVSYLFMFLTIVSSTVLSSVVNDATGDSW